MMMTVWWNKSRKISVKPSGDKHLVLLLSCKRRDRSCATCLLSLAPHILVAAPSPPLSLPLPLLSITAHIWFWVKARLVSSGMEGFYFSLAPLPLQFHSPVCIRVCSLFTNLCSFSLCWIWLVLIFISGENFTIPMQLMGAGMLVVWWSSRLSCGALLSVTSRWLNCEGPGELPLLATNSASNYYWDCWPGLRIRNCTE